MGGGAAPPGAAGVGTWSCQTPTPLVAIESEAAPDRRRKGAGQPDTERRTRACREHIRGWFVPTHDCGVPGGGDGGVTYRKGRDPGVIVIQGLGGRGTLRQSDLEG